ncbi:cation:proton antiporter [Legionella impletisoli]|uniref:Sodium:proton antiporter n=1 Tax=Legionella impletisoli TaxID=343510 RepID=A0A917JXW5_9GAMM|nr:cation:proton antiporter [Legionella impletisoli]GGI91573.1 sodium:proton antiporter [Legionella impletisoli]
MRRFRFWPLIILFFPPLLYAGVGDTHFEPVASVILWVTLIFFLGITGRYIAELLNQPGVLGELLMGVLVGNLFYFLGMPLALVLREGPAIYSIMNDLLTGIPLHEAVTSTIHDPTEALQMIQALKGASGASWLKVAYVVDIFSRYGVIFLLFMVGLETSVDELVHTGMESLKVAVIGVVAPILLAMGFMYIFMPFSSYQSDLFVAATLSATSIGITARVLKELKKVQTREAKTILGAAMIDDILGLIALAIVTSIVVSGALDIFNVSRIILLSVLFFSIALLFGTWFLKKVLYLFKFLEVWEAKLFVTFIFVMLFSWFATLIQLATIIGAFAAGIIISEELFPKKFDRHNRLNVAELVAPLEFILAPLFFVLMGIQVKIELFFNLNVLFLAFGLIIAAILGKLVCGLGASRKSDRLLVGIGMLPRGEVGLIFASIGRKLEVISDQLFSAIILMVIVTTLIAPLWMKARYAKQKAVYR